MPDFATCEMCNLPDLYDGQGDGIGSCDCPSCEVCGAPDPAGLCEADHRERAAEWEGVGDA